MEIDHYEKCWCGSGKIIIDCHRMGKREYGNFISTHKNMYRSKKCYAPANLKSNCNGIVAAHTISKSRGLSHIAKDGKVLSCMIGVDKLIKNNYKLYFIPIGISQASVFNGFCKRHDQELFSCFENEIFTGSKEQCTALAYRSTAREIYILESNIKKNNYNQVRNNLYIDPHKAQMIVSAVLLSNNKSLQKLQKIKSIMDREILDKKYNYLKHVVIKTDLASKLALSSCIFPDHDFNGKPVERDSTSSKHSNYISVNTISEGKNNFIVLSYLKKSKLMKNFINSFLSIKKDKQTTALINLFFGYSENIYVSPAWWESLSIKHQERLEFLSNFHQNSPIQSAKIILNDTNVDFYGFSIKEIRTI